MPAKNIKYTLAQSRRVVERLIRSLDDPKVLALPPRIRGDVSGRSKWLLNAINAMEVALDGGTLEPKANDPTPEELAERVAAVKAERLEALRSK